MARKDRVIADAGWLCLAIALLTLAFDRIESFFPILFAGVGLLYLALPFRKLVIERNPAIVRYRREVRLSMLLLTLGIVVSLLDTTLPFVSSEIGLVILPVLLIGIAMLISGTLVWLNVLLKKRRSPNP